MASHTSEVYTRSCSAADTTGDMIREARGQEIPLYHFSVYTLRCPRLIVGHAWGGEGQNETETETGFLWKERQTSTGNKKWSMIGQLYFVDTLHFLSDFYVSRFAAKTMDN